MSKHVLEVRDLGVRYGQTEVLRQLSLSVARGEVVAVMGPSGSGKSSLLACITGMLLPTQGEVEISGQLITTMSARARATIRRTRLGLVYQRPELLPELSIDENVALTLLFDGMPRPAALARAREALAEVGMAAHASKRVDEVSAGQAQRVSLARAMVRPSMTLLVADEPTASLDATTARQVVQLMLDRTRTLDAGAILATHDPSVSSACDRVIDLRDLAIFA